VEIIVVDWGSDIPLSETLTLGADAVGLVSFLHVPDALARQKQRDSPFSEVFALNAAARRSRGEYIGRIDADTLVDRRFFATFFQLIDGSRETGIRMDSTFLFSRRRTIPYRFVKRCPPLGQVSYFIDRFGHRLPIENKNLPFFKAAVGIMLMHRTLWEDCGGYDERLIYMNFMEIDLALRLSQKYELADWGMIAGHDYYHLEHYHPFKRRYTRRKTNPYVVADNKDNAFCPNGPDWGLGSYSLELRPYSPGSIELVVEIPDQSRDDPLMYLTYFAMKMERLLIHLLYAYRWPSMFLQRWARRALIAWNVVSGKPVLKWPSLLTRLWMEKRLEKKSHAAIFPPK